MPYTKIRILKGKGTNIMGMAASQARLLSITSRMADNELRAQIANNAKMRLAADSSKISADYVTALNNATMMITNYNEAGDSQFSKLTFNRLTEYSPFNTQYGLANTYGQLLVNENEAKIFEAAGGVLSKYLEAHGLKFDTTYFTDNKFNLDENGTVVIKSEFGEKFANLSVEDLKTMYFGGRTSDGVYHKGYAANEDVYDSYIKQVSNYNIAFDKWMNEPQAQNKLVTENIKAAVNRVYNNADEYEGYRKVASVEDLSVEEYQSLLGKSADDVKRKIENFRKLIYDISINGDGTDGNAYVKGATLAYYNSMIDKYWNTNEDGTMVLKTPEELGYNNALSLINKPLYVIGNDYTITKNIESNFIQASTIQHQGDYDGYSIAKETTYFAGHEVGDSTTTVRIGSNKVEIPNWLQIDSNNNLNNNSIIQRIIDPHDFYGQSINWTNVVGDGVSDYNASKQAYYINLFDSSLKLYPGVSAHNQIPAGSIAFVKGQNDDYYLVFGQNSTCNSCNMSNNPESCYDNAATSTDSGWVTKKPLSQDGPYTEYVNAYIYKLTDENALTKDGVLRIGKPEYSNNTDVEDNLIFEFSSINGGPDVNGSSDQKFKFIFKDNTLFVCNVNDDNTVKAYKINDDDNKTMTEYNYKNEKEVYTDLFKELCRDAFGSTGGTSTGKYIDSVSMSAYLENFPNNANAKVAKELKDAILARFGIDLANIATSSYNYLGSYASQLAENGRNGSAVQQSIYDNYVINCIFDIYGEPNLTWTDSNNPTGDAEAKVQWYTNLFERMSKGYTVIEDGLASSNEWMEYALESGLVAIEQVDKANQWNGTPHKNVASITEVTDEVAVARAEAEYKKAMNEVEHKDKRLDIELKNIDTEHNALQTEYESVKSVISKNVERTFKMYSA